jgi:hypothetical protein
MSLGITDDEHAEAEREIQLASYREALRLAWSSGVMSPDESQALENLRTLFAIHTDEQRAVEAEVLEAMRGKDNGA